MAEHDVEKIWAEFWVPCLDNAVEGTPLGPSIAIPASYFDQIKRELYDYHARLEGLSVFFDEITGGHVSKPNTKLSVVAEFVEGRREAAYHDGYADGRDDGYDTGFHEARSA